MPLQSIKKWAFYYVEERYGAVPPDTAWRDVGYVSINHEDLIMTCDLCETGPIRYYHGRKTKQPAVSQHIDGRKHQLNHETLCAEVQKQLQNAVDLTRYSELQRSFKAADIVHRQLDGLLDSQKAAVCNILYQHVKHQYDKREKGAQASEKHAVIERAHLLVRRYTRLETAVALDLAMLKASLGPEFDSMDDLRVAFCLTHGTDDGSAISDIDNPVSAISYWARNRRSVNGRAVVIQLILAHVKFS